MTGDLDFVASAERSLLDPLVRADAGALDLLLDAEFTEIGAAGHRWNRDELIAYLATSPRADDTVVTEMRARHVTDDVIVVEYTTSTPQRVVHRSSWWRRRGSEWRCYFHQGTPSPG